MSDVDNYLAEGAIAGLTIAGCTEELMKRFSNIMNPHLGCDDNYKFETLSMLQHYNSSRVKLERILELGNTVRKRETALEYTNIDTTLEKSKNMYDYLEETRKELERWPSKKKENDFLGECFNVLLGSWNHEESKYYSESKAHR